MNIALAGFLIGLIVTATFSSLASFLLKRNQLIAALITAFPTKIFSVLIILLLYTEKRNLPRQLKDFTFQLYKVLFILAVIFFIIHKLLVLII